MRPGEVLQPRGGDPGAVGVGQVMDPGEALQVRVGDRCDVEVDFNHLARWIPIDRGSQRLQHCQRINVRRLGDLSRGTVTTADDPDPQQHQQDSHRISPGAGPGEPPRSPRPGTPTHYLWCEVASWSRRISLADNARRYKTSSSIVPFHT